MAEQGSVTRMLVPPSVPCVGQVASPPTHRSNGESAVNPALCPDTAGAVVGAAAKCLLSDVWSRCAQVPPVGAGPP